MAGRIYVDTVIELVSEEVRSGIARLTTDKRPNEPPQQEYWKDATPVDDNRRGYLQHLDQQGHSDWAAEHQTAIRLLVRPGDFIFPEHRLR